MLIPMHKYYFDIVDNSMIVKITNINLSPNDKISLVIDDKEYEISNKIKIKKFVDRVYQAKIDIPKNLNLESENIKLIINKSDSLVHKINSKSKILVDLIYTPNILKNYSDIWLHRVSKDEKLSDIALKYYGDKNMSNIIYEANIDRIDNTNSIKEGQILRIPKNRV